jgi:hypothetical protein
MANAAPVGSRRAGAAPATTHDNEVVRSMPPERGFLERLFGG